MQIIKKILVSMCASLLLFMLLSFGVGWSVRQVLSGPGYIKQALAGSAIYQTIIQDTLTQTQKDSHQGDTIRFDDPQVQAVIKQAFPPSFLQSQTEGVIDAAYAWLQGKTTKLAFTIDLTDAKQRLANGLSTYAAQRLSSLPVCTAATAPANVSDVDPFSASCIPPNFDATAAATKVANDIQREFLDDTKITADTVKLSNGKTLNQALNNTPGSVPNAFHNGTWAILTAAVGAVLFAAAVVFLSQTRRGGLRTVAIIAICAGAFSIGAAWLSSFGMHRAVEELSKRSSDLQPLQQKLVRAAELLVNDLRTWWMLYGAVLIILGMGILIALLVTKQKARAGQGTMPAAGTPTIPENTFEMPRLPAKQEGHGATEASREKRPPKTRHD